MQKLGDGELLLAQGKVSRCDLTPKPCCAAPEQQLTYDKKRRIGDEWQQVTINRKNIPRFVQAIEVLREPE